MEDERYRFSWPGWETVRLIGQGSYGAVYEIQRELVDGTVAKAALKVISIPQRAGDIAEMRADGYDDESITSTFHSHLKSIVGEYSTMQKMNGSSNIVNCDDVHYESHTDGFGWDVYIKMELLTPLVDSLPKAIPEEIVVKVGTDICTALELCQRHAVIHRDIKPQNIFVSAHGDYKLGDFGIAKTVEKTMGGTITGTYKYMAPEVYNNQPYGAAADQYSLGLVLYWMLNERRLPFVPLGKVVVGAENQARDRRFNGEPIPAPKNGSEELKRIVLKACAFDPKERFANAAEMLAALKALGKPTPIIVADKRFREEQRDLLDDQAEDETIGILHVNAWEKRKDSIILENETGDVLPIVEYVGDVPAEEKGIDVNSDMPDRAEEVPVVERKLKQPAVLYTAVIGAVILIMILLLRSCFNVTEKPTEIVPDDTFPTVMEETENQTAPPTNPPVTEPEETLPIQLEWSEWMDALPEYVDSSVYDVEEQTFYRSRNLETTSSTTSKTLKGWEYVETIDGTGDFGPWSDWSDTKVKATDSREVEKQTRYRHREKETTTSSNDSKKGWTLYDTTYSWGSYGSWSSWNTDKVTSDDGRQVEKKTQYSYRDKWITQEYSEWSSWSSWSSTRESTGDLKKEESRTVWPYYYFLCSNCGAHMHGYGSCYTWAGGCGAATNVSGWREIWSTTSWNNAGLSNWHGTGKYYTYINGELCFQWSDTSSKNQYRYATRKLVDVTNYGSWSKYSDTEYTESSSCEVKTRTVYRYRDREKIPTYHFYRWGSWSNWSETEVSATDNRQVETTKYYRYRDRVTEQTHYFQRWTDWTEYLPEEIMASGTTEVETKQQYRFRSKS